MIRIITIYVVVCIVGFSLFHKHIHSNMPFWFKKYTRKMCVEVKLFDVFLCVFRHFFKSSLRLVLSSSRCSRLLRGLLSWCLRHWKYTWIEWIRNSCNSLHLMNSRNYAQLLESDISVKRASRYSISSAVYLNYRCFLFSRICVNLWNCS